MSKGRIQKPAPQPQKTDETKKSESKDLKPKSEELKAEMDNLIDEIDSVLEENAEQFVTNYIQRGGE